MSAIPITKINYSNTNIDVLRLDQAFPEGNKYFKLKNNLAAAKQEHKKTLLTFGGAFSNHLYAVALAGHEQGFTTIGLVRGEEDLHNPTLNAVKELGMEIHFISRLAYQHKNTLEILTSLRSGNSEMYVIPEGGSNSRAVDGARDILTGIENNYSGIFCAVGTGGTLAGIISTPGLSSAVTGISTLKGNDTLTASVKELAGDQIISDWHIDFNYHFGGYAQYDSHLMRFIEKIHVEYGLLTDPIYTSRVLYAVFDQIDKKMIDPQEKILVIHTGGLQGWKGWNYRFNNKMDRDGISISLE